MKFLVIAFCMIFVVSGDIAKDDKINAVTEETRNPLEGMDMPPGMDKILAGLPDINEGDDMFKEKCLKAGTNESYINATTAKEAFELCVSDLVDIKELKEEINRAKPTGDLDTVFKKYCHKTPVLRSCITDLLDGFQGCLKPEERGDVYVLQNITNSLLNFVCFKEGDRIALFIAEGGPECLNDKMEKISACVNSTVNAAKGNLNVSTEEMPDIVFDSEKCGYFTQVQKCVVQVLEECSEPTPANIIGSLFDFVRKSTPCKQYLNASGSSKSVVFSVMSFLVPLGAIILSKI
ncbi:27 kDa glycoprotein [Halyomorpha halys]|uniref:27 kDa glycoprotein n=1 Tax=Halyomorpha halys TaxID=286706 RepID=UPI0006D4F5C0|nr:27 kDa glycoprotein-like [Halyomorpha halys]